MKSLSIKSLYTFTLLSLLAFLQACTTVEYKNNLAQKDYLEKEIASPEYKEKQEKLNNLSVELQTQEEEKAQLEEELPTEANKFNEFFAEKMEYEKENFIKFNETFYNHTYNINLIDKDINQNYLKENKIYFFQYDNLVIDKIVSSNAIEIKSPFNILDIIATNEVNSKITIDNNENNEGVVKWSSSNSKTPSIIISYNTKNVLVNTKLECKLFEYKGVSKDGKSLLFDCIKRDEFLKDPKNKEDFINWLINYGYYEFLSKNTLFKELKDNNKCYNEEENLYEDCEETKIFDDILHYYFSFYHNIYDNLSSEDEDQEDILPFGITKTKVKSILEKNIYYINSQANYNVISKEYSSYLEIKNTLNTKINEKQEIINNLNNQILELTVEINKPNDDLNSVNSKLIIAGKDNSLRFFTPSFYSKYTTTTRWALVPYTIVGTVTSPIWIWWILKSPNEVMSSNIYRIDIASQLISGSLDLQAVRIDDISLLLDKNSQSIQVFNKKGTEKAYFFESGWLSSSNVDLPNGETVWSVEKGNNTKLTPSTPVNLFWKNSKGFTFKKNIAIDDSYMITITDTVINNSGEEVTINPFSLIVRHGDPEVEDMSISHEGFVGYVGGTLERVDYGDVIKENYEFNTTGGYVGFISKKYLTAIVIDKSKKVLARYISYKDSQKIDNFQVDVMGRDIKLSSGEQVANTLKLFVGDKDSKFNELIQN